MSQGLNRHLRVARYTIGSLRRRWRKNAAVVGVYALVIFTLTSVVLLTQSLTQESVASLHSSPEIMVQWLSAGRHGLSPASEAETLAQIAGVGAVVPRRWAYLADPATRETLLIRVGESGRLGDHEALAGEDFLRRRGVVVGVPSRCAATPANRSRSPSPVRPRPQPAWSPPPCSPSPKSPLTR